MSLNEAVQVILRDMCGYNDSSFAEAFLCAAYSSNDDLASEGVILDTEVMRTTISSIISKNADVTQSLVHARLKSAGEAKQLALINGFDIIPVIHGACSLCETPIISFDIAMAIINSGEESPKFNEAIDWVMTVGNDVPEDFRKELTMTVDQAFESLGVECSYDKNGEPLYNDTDIVSALSGNTLH